MDKALLLALTLILIGSATAWPISNEGRTTTDLKYPVHWMPNYTVSVCEVAVNAYSTKMVDGIVGNRSDGTQICYVPRRKRGK